MSHLSQGTRASCKPCGSGRALYALSKLNVLPWLSAPMTDVLHEAATRMLARLNAQRAFSTYMHLLACLRAHQVLAG